MRDWTPDRIAQAAGAELVAAAGAAGDRRPEPRVIDSREAGPGDLFVGLPGERADGGAFASEAPPGRGLGACWSRPSTRERGALRP